MNNAPESSKPTFTQLAENGRLPPLNLLNLPTTLTTPAGTKEALMAKSRLIQQTLAQFGMKVVLGDITPGPTVTRYELIPAPGIDLEAILRLSRNLTAALKADNIHIIAPVPRKGTVGIEVPNANRTIVPLREMLNSEEWRASKASIPLAIGKGLDGSMLVADLAEMPHLLIGGRAGSGRSSCLHALIASLVYRFSPDQLRLVMIDTQVTDLIAYNILPQLVAPVITDSRKALITLRWVLNEIQSRARLFARVGARSLEFFNERPITPVKAKVSVRAGRSGKTKSGDTRLAGLASEVDTAITHEADDDEPVPAKLAPMVVLISELADLMVMSPGDSELILTQILRMGRAVGVHCIIGTERPEVDVITGTIAGNIPSRIALRVASRVDSRTILDALGAEKLLGKGDLLYLAAGEVSLQRGQGAFISETELQRVLNYFGSQTGKPKQARTRRRE